MATITVPTSNSRANWQTAVNSASAGDTVVRNAGSSTVTWTDESLTCSKAITLDFNGLTVTWAGTTVAGQFPINAGSLPSTGNFQVINGTFVVTSTYANFHGIQLGSASGFPTANPFRIYNCTFTCAFSITFIDVYNITGLITGCSLSADNNAEMIHVPAYGGGTGSGDSTGWSVDVVPGSANAVYIEACTFTRITQTGAFQGCSAVQSYFGARTVFRYNSCIGVHVDQHGTAGDVGARWWEIYNNAFDPKALAVDNLIRCRGGSGVIYSNTNTGTGTGAQSIEFQEEDSGSYPLPYQVGRGKSANGSPPYDTNQALDPAYCWNNFVTPASSSSVIQSGRDFYPNTQKPAYTAFQYPYPWGSTAPTLSSASINTAGTQLTLTWSASVTNGAGGSGGTALTPSGGASTPTYSSGSGSTSYVFTLSRIIQQGETLTVAYTQPGNGFEATSDGTDVVTFSGTAVTNNSTVTPPAAGGSKPGSAALRFS